MKISFVIPCYKSEKTLPAVVEEIKTTMAELKYDFEIVLVNDSSPDNTFGTIKELAGLNDNITGGIDTILSVDRSGVMVGKYPLLQKMKSGLGFLAKQLVKKQSPKFVTKMARSVFLVIRRQCIKWFSMVVAKEDVAMAFELLIPITCAIISGIVSVVVLIPMCNKLQKKIKSGTLHAALQTNQDTNANIEEESVRRS